jgi:CubicO group peptidase (beta-lactamase class C family)
MKKILCFLVVAVLFFNFSYSQTGTIAALKPQLLQPAKTGAPGFSPERLKRIDDFIQRYIDSNLFNGTAAIIVQDGKIIYHKALGYYNAERKIPLRTDNIFRIASMTKPVISTAAMMLYEEGKFLLDDPVSKFIPEFKNAVVLDKYNAADTTYTTVPAKREITIRNLLSQTSGIGYAQIGSEQANAIYYKNNINGGIGTPYSTLKNVIPRLAKLPLFSQPGESFLYGLNTDVLGYLIEVISGMPLDKFLKEKLFDPLGMKDTYFFLPAEKQNRLVPLYMQAGNRVLQIQDSVISLNGSFHRDFPKTAGGTYFSGGAGLSSTAYDYALFCQMLLNGGEYNGVRFLSPHTIGLMTKNQIGNLTMWGNPDNPTRFGLGFGVYTEKSEAGTPVAAGSYDWAGMFASHFWIDPKNKIVAVFMRNVWPTQHWDFGDRIKPLVYQALK